MCSECGDIYTQAGYKIIVVPLTGASPVIIKKEHLAVTQEPAGSSIILEEETEPPRPSQVIDEQKPESKSFTTVHI